MPWAEAFVNSEFIIQLTKQNGFPVAFWETWRYL